MSWIVERGPMDDVVLSSRIRLARNISNLPFPSVMSSETAREVLKMVRDSILKSNSTLSREFTFMELKNMSENDQRVLVEKHLMSPDLVNSELSGIMIDRDERVSIMINEEDHIRIQTIFAGYQLEKAWELISKVDDLIEESIEYSFDEELGYLTCCPTNVGTGMRASVMMHLPGLVMTGNINSMLHAISQIGLTVRGIYGEGSEALGNIFQVSNQVTLGPSEEEIIYNLHAAVDQIISNERKAREMLIQSNGKEFEDKAWRAVGVLAFARKIGIQEFMALFSQIRVGMDMGIIRNIRSDHLNELMILVQPAHLQKNSREALTVDKMDRIRADIVRRKIRSWMGSQLPED